ncbi:hypothetical protein JHJ32_18625, partial [Parapedobacter sp. ISTM3]|uniref:hypothetical protein n=1 Tax=Parapedobacter sp. ISTM3 TaxID=2800130 RepID=UPI001903A70E
MNMHIWVMSSENVGVYKSINRKAQNLIQIVMITFRILACLLLFTAFVCQANSQTLSVPNFVPQTPEISWGQRFGEIPVSEYTGVPSISIPFHTIKLKNTELPLSLDYHAGGIKVKDEASWVGLGWNLTNLGTITVEPVGGPDNPIIYANNNDWQSTINRAPLSGGHPSRYLGTHFPMMDCGIDDPNLALPNERMINESFNGNGERDVYHANFLGNSIKFYIAPITNNIVIVGEKKPYTIEKTTSGWKIVDDLGYQYFFNGYEYYRYDGMHNQLNNTWHLTNVVFQGKELLKIVHNTVQGIQMLPQLSDMVVDKQEGTVGIQRKLTHVSEFYARYPTYLVSALDSIVFVTGSRVDFRNAPALNYIRIYNRREGSLVKTIEFQKDYFLGAAVGSETSTLDYVTKRLRLNKLLIRGTGSEVQEYGFTYHGQLPYKTSFSQDFWGYYNGQNNTFAGNVIGGASYSSIFSLNRTLLPTAASLAFEENIPNPQLQFAAANRGVSEAHVVAGSLKSITYPTGGRTEFEYEPHRVNNVTYVKSSQSLGTGHYQRVINNRNTSFSTPMVQFAVTQEVRAKIKILIKATTYNLTDFNAFNVVLVTNVGSPSPVTRRYAITTDEQKQEFNRTRTVTIEDEITLPVGGVVLAANVGSNLPDQGYTFNNGVLAELTYFEGINMSQEYDSYVGGLRIKTIRNYESGNVLAGTKSFHYIDQNGKPSGKLVYPMRFFHRENTRYQKFVGGGVITIVSEYRSYDYFHSDNYYSYANGYAPSPIGYSRVVIRDVDPQGNNKGETVKHFNNVAVESYFSQGKKFVPKDIFSHALNGKLQKQTYLSSSADSLVVEEYRYKINNLSHNYTNVSITDLYDGPIHCNARTAFLNSNRFDVIVSAYSNFNVQLDIADKRELMGNGRVSVRKTYKYDAQNYKVSEVAQTGSDGVTVFERTMYPKNFTSITLPLYPILVGANMVGVPIEKTVLKNGKIVDYSRIDYGTWGGVIAPQHYYRKDAEGNNYRVATFSRYDAFGNPLEFQEYDGPPTTYLWGYDGQYLVARIENNTYAAVTNTGVNLSVLNSLTSTETAKA